VHARNFVSGAGGGTARETGSRHLFLFKYQQTPAASGERARHCVYMAHLARQRGQLAVEHFGIEGS